MIKKVISQTTTSLKKVINLLKNSPTAELIAALNMIHPLDIIRKQISRVKQKIKLMKMEEQEEQEEDKKESPIQIVCREITGEQYSEKQTVSEQITKKLGINKFPVVDKVGRQKNKKQLEINST